MGRVSTSNSKTFGFAKNTNILFYLFFCANTNYFRKVTFNVSLVSQGSRSIYDLFFHCRFYPWLRTDLSTLFQAPLTDFFDWDRRPRQICVVNSQHRLLPQLFFFNIKSSGPLCNQSIIYLAHRAQTTFVCLWWPCCMQLNDFFFLFFTTIP